MIYLGVATCIALATLIALLVNQNGERIFAGVVGVTVFILWTIGMSAAPVTTGHVGIKSWFGAVQPGFLTEGLRFTNPMFTVTWVSVQRGAVDFGKAKDADGPTMIAQSSDRNPLHVEAQFPYFVNSAAAWQIIQRIGTIDTLEKTVLVPAARSATREVIGKHDWVYTAITNRAQVEDEMRVEFERTVTADLLRLGFTPAEAAATITALPVLLREALPDDKVLNAIAERVASEEDLKRQIILTNIAKAIAERRAQEGIGVAKLFEQLPTGFTPAQIRDVLGALADKERADAQMKAVETGKVMFMVVPGSSPVAVSVPR